jgi:hypothetical protein
VTPEIKAMKEKRGVQTRRFSLVAAEINSEPFARSERFAAVNCGEE